jgi:hypothetical protein
VSALRGSRKADTGPATPAYGVKSFLVTFFQKSNCLKHLR